MIQELVLLILGAIIGAIFGIVLPPLIKAIQHKHSLRKKTTHDAALSNECLITWLRGFHQYHWDKRGISNELPFCQIGSYGDYVPYLSKNDWDVPNALQELHRVDIQSDTLLRFTNPPDRSFHINNRLINRRKEWGHDLWNAGTLYLEHISSENGLPVFHVTTCQYYASATSMFLLENETVSAVRRNRFDKCKIRQKYYLQTKNIEKNLFKPITIGCLVVFALKLEEGYRILIQVRSKKTATANMVHSVCPVFGLSPFIGRAPQQKGLLYYNFLREYLEELHFVSEVRGVRGLKKEHLILGSAQSYNEYIYGHEKARQLIECDQFDLYYIGFGFNLANGNPNIGLLAKIDDISLSKRILDSKFVNWEVHDINDVKVNSDKLENLFSNRELDPASSFFLSKALRYLG